MKIAIYSPYLDTAGGGEKYVLTIASFLSQNHQVDVLLDSHLVSIGLSEIKQKLRKLHKLDLSKVQFIKAPIGRRSSFLSRAFFLRKYDWIFYLTDGSIFYSTAKNSIIHFQVPFQNIKPKNMWNKWKLSSFKEAIYNSKFTKDIIEQNWPIKGRVIYPPVNVFQIKPQKKLKQILSVGRFSSFLKSKKHELMIKTFKELQESGELKGWSLNLAGGIDEGDKIYLQDLKNLIGTADINLHPNIPIDQLYKLYGQSSIYWHAAGFGESNPEKMEHFGISTVEAMAAGCVPIVVNLGGQKEIVTPNLNGLLWDSPDQLKEYTIEIVKDDSKRKKLGQLAIKRALDFDEANFYKQITNLINDQK